MKRQALEATVRAEGKLAVIAFRGDIDGGGEQALQQAYTEAAAIEPEAILLRFDAVDYINSTGIALIVRMLAQARAQHINVLTSGLSDHYEHIFTITRLADFMSIYPDEATAIASLQSATL